MAKANEKKQPSIEEIIKKAVAEVYAAGQDNEAQRKKSYYKMTERRLYALPDIKEKVANDKEQMGRCGPTGRSKDVVRFQRSGVRLTYEEIAEAMEQDLRAKIAANENEIKIMEDALDPLTSDPYFRVIPAKYFEQKGDPEIASELNCDDSTVRRNRSRLVNRLVIRLYGAAAI